MRQDCFIDTQSCLPIEGLSYLHHIQTIGFTHMQRREDIARSEESHNAASVSRGGLAPRWVTPGAKMKQPNVVGRHVSQGVFVDDVHATQHLCSSRKLRYYAYSPAQRFEHQDWNTPTVSRLRTVPATMAKEGRYPYDRYTLSY